MKVAQAIMEDSESRDQTWSKRFREISVSTAWEFSVYVLVLPSRR